MKFSLLAGVAVAAMILAAPQASAGGYKPYVSVFGGASVLTKNPHGGSTGNPFYGFDYLMNNPGYIVGGAVGVDWGDQIRAEVELSHARWTSDKYNFAGRAGGGAKSGTGSATTFQSATYLLGNAWYDLDHGTQFTPYFGGGLGIGWARIDQDGIFLWDASGLAFQLGAGIRFNVSDHLSFDAGYRFKDIVGMNYSRNTQYTITDTSLASHNFQIGLTYQF